MVAPAFATISRGGKCFDDINSLGCIVEGFCALLFYSFAFLHHVIKPHVHECIHLFFCLHNNELYYILRVLVKEFTLDVQNPLCV